MGDGGAGGANLSENPFVANFLHIEAVDDDAIETKNQRYPKTQKSLYH